MFNTRAPHHTVGRTPPEERRPFGYTMVPVTFDEHPPFCTHDTHLDAEEDLEDEGNVAVMDEGKVHERTRDV
jgi:hypothetical protein